MIMRAIALMNSLLSPAGLGFFPLADAISSIRLYAFLDSSPCRVGGVCGLALHGGSSGLGTGMRTTAERHKKKGDLDSIALQSPNCPIEMESFLLLFMNCPPIDNRDGIKKEVNSG